MQRKFITIVNRLIILKCDLGTVEITNWLTMEITKWFLVHCLICITGKPRYAETWDFHVMPSSSLQFELSMGCSKPFSDSHTVQLQYSLNNGRDWHQVTEECVPTSIGCLHYTESSMYSSERFQIWKRITISLPPSTM